MSVFYCALHGAYEHVNVACRGAYLCGPGSAWPDAQLVTSANVNVAGARWEAVARGLHTALTNTADWIDEARDNGASAKAIHVDTQHLRETFLNLLVTHGLGDVPK